MLICDLGRYGAAGVWVGTRFVASAEAGAPPKHKEMLLSAGYDDTVRTLVYSGRPMSVRKTPYLQSWYVLRTVHHCKLYSRLYHRESRQDEIKALTAQGKIPHEAELEKHPEKSLEGRACTNHFL